jgi:hypothetical protein
MFTRELIALALQARSPNAIPSLFGGPEGISAGRTQDRRFFLQRGWTPDGLSGVFAVRAGLHPSVA